MLPQTYLDNIDQKIFLCNAASLTDNIAQEFYFYKIVQRVSRQHGKGFYLMLSLKSIFK